MNKTLILYQSKYGATKRYVDALQQNIACDMMETKSCNIKMIENYDTIIFAGSVYAGVIKGVSFLKKNASAFANKHVAVFAVGLKTFSDSLVHELQTTNGIEEHIPVFYGRGAVDFNKLSLGDRLIFKAIKKALSKKDPASLDEGMRDLITNSDEANDWVDYNYLAPLLSLIKNEKSDT